MDRYFKQAVDFVIGNEGGYVYDPDDPGGETKYGISKRSYPDIEIKDLTRQAAEAIYFRDWWQKYGYWQITARDVQLKLFDLAVLMGPYRAHKIAQKAVNQTGYFLIEDGALGPDTIDAINLHNYPGWLLDRIRILAVGRLVGLNKEKYLGGWVKRAIL